MSATTESSSPALDTFRDIILWRRKKLSASVLLVSTATWVLLQVYRFNFITVASWVVMFIVGSLFMWGNILRLLGKEPPILSDLEISEQNANEIANTCRTLIEEAIRWMFHVTVEGDWFVFARTIVGFLFLSYVGSFFEFLTLLHIGIQMLMTIPVTYDKYGNQIKRCGEMGVAQFRRFCGMFNERVIRQVKNKFDVKEEKERYQKNKEEKEKKVE
ncbi:Reticulon [Corchorus capsularis]|uniref:Reticulon-like protein n=1 Tax=Corchorus capsularis TaxID=210143 RepID=A0A1R3GF90_COCAP|nr:Reticulon [Corchorus capsularis]